MRFMRLFLGLLSALLFLTSCLSRRDSLSPIITIYDPPNGATKGLVSPVVSGYAMDDNGIESIRVDNVDLLSSDAYKDERGKKLVQFFFKVNLDSGEFSADIVAQDKAGNMNKLPYKLIIDTQAPTLEVSATPLSDSRLRVSGIARDNDAVKFISIEGVSQAFLPASEQAFTVDVTASGATTVIVRDRAGNEISVPVSP